MIAGVIVDVLGWSGSRECSDSRFSPLPPCPEPQFQVGVGIMAMVVLVLFLAGAVWWWWVKRKHSRRSPE